MGRSVARMPPRIAFGVVALVGAACAPIEVRPEAHSVDAPAAPVVDESPPMEPALVVPATPETVLVAPPPVESAPAVELPSAPEENAPAAAPPESAPVPPEPVAAPIEPVLTAPALLTLGHVRNAALVQGRQALGSVVDLWLIERSGAVAGVRVSLSETGTDGVTEVFDWSALAWLSAESAFLLAEPLRDAALREAGFDFGGLFDGQGLSTIVGEVTEVEPLLGAPLALLVLKVRDEDNLLHRVLIEAGSLVSLCLPGVAPGQVVEVEGVLTRDEKGKVWIASAVTHAGTTVRLRAADGSMAWDELGRHFLSAQHILETPLRASDGTVYAVRDLVLDPAAAGATAVWVEVEGVVRALDWSELVRVEDGWTVARDAAGLAALPATSMP